MPRFAFARIDFEPSRYGGVRGKLLICPYAAVFQPSDSADAEDVTDYFSSERQIHDELERLDGMPSGTKITPGLVEEIGMGCEELGRQAIARLKFPVGRVTLASSAHPLAAMRSLASLPET